MNTTDNNNHQSTTNQQELQQDKQQQTQVTKQNEYKQLKKQITYSCGMRLDTKELKLDNLIHRCNEIENLTRDESADSLKRTAEFENLTHLDDD